MTLHRQHSAFGGRWFGGLSDQPGPPDALRHPPFGGAAPRRRLQAGRSLHRGHLPEQPAGGLYGAGPRLSDWGSGPAGGDSDAEDCPAAIGRSGFGQVMMNGT